MLLTAEGVVESPFCGKFWDGMREAGRLVTFAYFHDNESAWRQYVAQPQCVFLCLGMRRHPTPLDLHMVATCKTIAVFEYILGNETSFDQHPRDVVWCLSVQGAGVYRTLFHDKLGASLRTRGFPALRSGTDSSAANSHFLQMEVMDKRAQTIEFWTWTVADLQELYLHMQWSLMRSAWISVVATGSLVNARSVATR